MWMKCGLKTSQNSCKSTNHNVKHGLSKWMQEEEKQTP